MKDQKTHSMLVFSLNAQRFAIPYYIVSRVIRAIEIAPIPKKTPELLGVINFHGDIITVIDIRYFLALPEAHMTIHDNIVIIHLHNQELAFVVENVNFINFPDSAIHQNREFNLSSISIKTMIKDFHGIIPILDMASLVTQADIPNGLRGKQATGEN